MSDVTIRVPEDIIQALRLPPDAVQTELQRERGHWRSTSGVSSLRVKRPLLPGWTGGSGRNCAGSGRFPGTTTGRTLTGTLPMPLAVIGTLHVLDHGW